MDGHLRVNFGEQSVARLCFFDRDFAWILSACCLNKNKGEEYIWNIYI